MSWGTSSLHNCERIHGYPQAQRFFESEPQRKGKRWLPNERPLYKPSTHHYRIRHLSKEDVYELVLYNTAMVRYEKPDAATGEYRVLLRGYGTATSWQFLHDQGWGWWKTYHTTDCRDVFVPLSQSVGTSFEEWAVCVPAGWSAVLTFRHDGALIVEKSNHRLVGTKQSTQEDKDARAAFLKKMNTLFDLALLRLPTFHENSTFSWRSVRPFRDLGFTIGHAELSNVKQTLRLAALGEDCLITEECMEAFMSLCQGVYMRGASRKTVDDGPNGIRPPPLTPLTEKEFLTALKGAVLRYASLQTQSGMKELPKFPESLPNRYYSL